MIVLYVVPYFLPYYGGVEQAVYHLALSVLKEDASIEINVLTSFSSYPKGFYKDLPDFEVLDGIKVHRLNFWFKNVPGFYHSYNAGFFSPKLFSKIRSIKPDIIHYFKTEWFVTNSLIYLLSRQNVKHIFTSSFHNKSIDAKHVPMVLFNKFLLKKMYAVITASKETAMALVKNFDIELAKINVLPWGVNLYSSHTDPGLNNRVSVLCIGRFNEAKGQLRFLKEFSYRYNYIFEKIIFNFVGDDDGDLRSIEEFIKDNHENVHIYMGISDKRLEDLIADSQIYISPSRYEAFGLSIVQALSNGLPVIAFNMGAISESVTKGAILIEYPDWEKFCGAVVKLIENHKLREELSTAGKKFVSARYSWSRTAINYIEIYNSNIR